MCITILSEFINPKIVKILILKLINFFICTKNCGKGKEFRASDPLISESEDDYFWRRFKNISKLNTWTQKIGYQLSNQEKLGGFLKKTSS